MAITTPSSEALLARSPMPLMVHSTCRAPALTAAREFATARPRSLWQCTETVICSMPGYLPPDGPNQIGEFRRDSEPNGIGNVDCGCTRLDCHSQHVAKEIRIRTGSVFRREL
jgi:hypothetical protein